MPPKPRYTKEEITSVAYELVRREGKSALTARSLAIALGTSTAPIFTAFESIDAVMDAVLKRAEGLYDSYLQEGFANPLPFKGAGLAYIRFAKDEPNLFRFLFMETERTTMLPHYLPGNDAHEAAVREKLQANGHDRETAMRIYNHLSVYVHGFATLFAFGCEVFTEDDIEKMLSEVFRALKDKETDERKEEAL